MNDKVLSFKVNGKAVQVTTSPDRLLVDVLREDLGLTGTKVGCREGECGACSVLLDGLPVNSCLVPVFKAAGREVTTIEGLESQDGALDRIQQAFMDAGAAQCGFCTPGMIINAKALLDANPHPSADEIKHALSGVLCRCTGYSKIIEAVQAVGATEDKVN
ncbi:MAG: (2Fe-2S)-binding protein [Pseudomonadota bacterium]